MRRKYDAIFITLLITTIFYLLIGYSSSQKHLKDIGRLRGSIIESRHLLDSPIQKLDEEARHTNWLDDSSISKKTLSEIKQEIEYAQIILENAQNSLEDRGF
ncbi:hypothetical protein E4K67_04215 [Desulfosporosinus fructosivorans]|uniref:Uncharacterized protein n=1 Tax=Desulfosporosinus fructosivorans TaxID=2018669 RepID=A0A4Z0R8W4_9FIRM|nr:hypothetical protein [Desulfosporosinus fructosivorans]TGE38699.1 hypothetical protein E4K67_04215 [Desulfosporosinus fructosivorans]